MKLIVLSIFIVAHIAFAAIGFRVWKYDKFQKLPLYFMVFSLFSAFYFSFVVLFVFANMEMERFIIFSWVVIYAMLPWFLQDYIGKQRRAISIGFSSIFFAACIFYFFKINFLGIITWQHLAHLGLIGLVLLSLRGLKELSIKGVKGRGVFFALVLIFALLVFDDIFTAYAYQSFLDSYTFGIEPLDLFPVIFSVVTVKKLRRNSHSRQKLNSSPPQTR